MRNGTRNENNMDVVTVIFRNDPDGEILALFPYVQGGQARDTSKCSCYQRVGQHGTANYTHCINMTKPAMPEEYEDLKRELESKPYEYKFRVRRMRSYWPNWETE